MMNCMCRQNQEGDVIDPCGAHFALVRQERERVAKQRSTDNSPAFPIQETDKTHFMPGMSLRDYFAVHANEQDIASAVSRHSHVTPNPHPNLTRSEARYAHADGMLAIRGKIPSE